MSSDWKKVKKYMILQDFENALHDRNERHFKSRKHVPPAVNQYTAIEQWFNGASTSDESIVWTYELSERYSHCLCAMGSPPEGRVIKNNAPHVLLPLISSLYRLTGTQKLSSVWNVQLPPHARGRVTCHYSKHSRLFLCKSGRMCGATSGGHMRCVFILHNFPQTYCV